MRSFMSCCVVSAVLCSAFLLVTEVLAQDAEDAGDAQGAGDAGTAEEVVAGADVLGEGSGGDGGIFQGVFGIKFMPGASYWTTPDGVDPDSPFGFAGDGGGFSWGAAIFAEARFVRFVGLEIDFIRDFSLIKRNVTYTESASGGGATTTRVIDAQERFELSSWRIPILLKGYVPLPSSRLFVLIGPEFVLASSVDASAKVTKEVQGSGLQPPSGLEAAKSGYTMLTMGLGISIDVAMFEIPIELRASKNLGQDSKWTDRSRLSGTTYTVDAQTSWDFRLSVGFGWRFYQY